MKNITFPSIPSELLEDINPANMKFVRNQTSKRKSVPKVTDAELKKMRLTDREKFLLVYLAAYGMVGNPSITTLLTCPQTGDGDKGFSTAMSELMSRYGVVFDPKKVFGTVTKKQNVYEKLRLASKRHGLFRTVLQSSGNVVADTALKAGGLRSGWVLTPRGVAVLLKISTRDDLTIDEIRFTQDDHHVSIVNQIHELQVSDFLTMLLMGANYYTTKGLPTEVVKAVGDGTDFEFSGKKFRPDLSGVVSIKNHLVPFMLEWDSGTTKPSDLPSKVERFCRLMVHVPDDKWSSGRPWLLMVHPNTTSAINGHSKAIKEAVKKVQVADKSWASEWCGIATCTHTDLGDRGIYGNIWRVWDYSENALTEEKYSLVSLSRKKVAEKKVIQEKVEAAPITKREGAAASTRYAEPEVPAVADWYSELPVA